MRNTRILFVAFTLAGAAASPLLAMSNFYDEPARLGDRDDTYTHLLTQKGRWQKIGASSSEFSGPLLKQLHDSIEHNHFIRLKEMLAVDAFLDLEGEVDGLRPLERAMLINHHETALLLVDHGASIENVRCAQHRGFLRFQQHQALPRIQVPRMPRQQSDSAQIGESPRDSGDDSEWGNFENIAAANDDHEGDAPAYARPQTLPLNNSAVLPKKILSSKSGEPGNGQSAKAGVMASCACLIQ